MISEKSIYGVIPKSSWEWLKNRDFVEIDFSESSPHSLLDI